ncbi:ribonuclease H-like domain-containing protein [Tanacetum coccineum]
MTVPGTAKEKICNEATKKTQKALLKQQYENFNASTSESLDSIFNRLQKLVSRLAILGVVTSQEDLNINFLRSLPSEWDTHVVVWMNKPDFESISLDDLYNNFKIVEENVKKSTGAINGDKNLAFVTTSGTSSTNNFNSEVSTGTTKVNTASTETYTARFSDATMYAILTTQPQGSQLLYEDLEQIHDDDLEEMDLKWNIALLSMRVRKFYQRTGWKIIIDRSNTAGFDKSKVECFNCHKMGHFARECRALRLKDSKNWNKGNSTKTVMIEDTREKAMCAIDGVGFDWSDMTEEQNQKNMALMAFSDSEANFDKSSSTYKRGLATLEEQIIKYKEHEVRFSEEVDVLKRSVGCKEYELGQLRIEIEKVKQEKEGIDFKIAKFDKSAKDLDEMLESQRSNKTKQGLGYTAIPLTHPLILNRPTNLDLSSSGLAEFKEPEVNMYGPRENVSQSANNCDKESDNSEENTDDSLEQHQVTKHQVSDSEISSTKSPSKVDKETFKDWKEKFFHPVGKVESDKPKHSETPVKRTIRYAEMYRSQRPRGNQRNWNGQKSNQLGCHFVLNNKACFIYGCFDHLQYNCPRTSQPGSYKYMTPRAILMKSGLKSLNTSRPINSVRSVNTSRSFSTASMLGLDAKEQNGRSYECTDSGEARVLKRKRRIRRVQQKQKDQEDEVFGRVLSAKKMKGNPQLNDKGFVNCGSSRYVTGNLAYLSNFKEFNGGNVTFGGGAYGGRITSKGTLKTNNLDFEDVYFVKELQFNLFSVSQICDKKNYVFFSNTEWLVLSPDFKLPDENQILLRIPSEDNMYSLNMHNIVPKENLICLATKATSDESMLWHRRLATKDETSEILKNFIKETKNLVDQKVKIIRSDNGTEFKNKVMDDFCREKGIKREYSVARTPQQNGVAERKNRTLIEAARTMLADSKLPTTFWAEVVSTACYVHNRVLVVKPHNKTPYELFRGFKPSIGFMIPFGCHVTILNTLDHLGKFNGKSDDGFFVGYSNKPMIGGNGPKWLFDIDSLTQSMNYVPVDARTISNDYVEKSNDQDDGTVAPQVNTASPDVNTGSNEVSTIFPKVNTATPEVLIGPSLSSKDIQVESFNYLNDQEVDLGNIPNSYAVPSTPNTRIHKDHLIEHVIGDVQSSIQTRRMSTSYFEQGFLSAVYEGKTHQDLYTCLFVCFLSQEEPKRISTALRDLAWVEAMQEELL